VHQFQRIVTAGLVTFVALLSTLLGPTAAGAGSAPGQDAARLRVGNFAAGLGDVRVEAGGRTLVERLPYGEVSDYLRVEPGTLTVTFRAADSPAGGQPTASADITLGPGATGSVLVAGAPDAVEAKAFLDDLSAPAPGSGRVRLVHLAPGVPAVDARVRQGVRLFEDAVFGETTSYIDVPEGAYDLEMLRAGTDQVLLAVRGVTVASGSVYTMVGTGGGDEAVEVRGFLDAAGAGATPAGGVATGLGGTADALAAPRPDDAAGAGTAAVAGLAVITAAWGLRRRRHAGPARP
jgi:hypothetical protein